LGVHLDDTGERLFRGQLLLERFREHVFADHVAVGDDPGAQLAVWNMRAINSSTVDITTNWLPSVRVLGELRAGVITCRNVIR
ncbi:hypothetical protein, partial [Bradyrhizobium uaiense]